MRSCRGRPRRHRSGRIGFGLGVAVALGIALGTWACGRYGPPSRYPLEPSSGAAAQNGEEAGSDEGGPAGLQPAEPVPQAEPLEESPSPDDGATEPGSDEERDDSEPRR